MEPRRGLGLGGSLILSALVVGLAIASGIIPFRQVITQRHSVDLSIRQRDALIAENLRLEQQITALQSPGEAERLAREQFGLVMPGEIAYVAVPVEDAAVVLPTTASPFAEHPPWWEKLWNFVTGRDLLTDE